MDHINKAGGLTSSWLTSQCGTWSRFSALEADFGFGSSDGGDHRHWTGI